MKFKRTNITLKLIAFGILALMLVPQFASAAESSVQTTVDVALDSAHQDQADEVVNAAQATPSNPSTWNPAIQGIYVGSSTKESLFQFNDVTLTVGASNSRMIVTGEFIFNASDIMSGGSQVVIRMPWHWQAGLTTGTVACYAMSSDFAFTISAPVDPTPWGHLSTFIIRVGSLTEIFTYNLDMTDTTITDGNHQYSRDGRTYLIVKAPLLPGVRYLFVAYVEYPSDSNFEVYLSPNDISNDQVQKSSIGRFIYLNPATYIWNWDNYSIDLGWSFDFQQGLGNGVTAFELWLNSGDELWFTTHLTPATGYMMIDIPFYTTSGSATFSVEAYYNLAHDSWTRASHSYPGAIICTSDSSLTPDTNDLVVMLTSEAAQLVRFYFEISNDPAMNMTSYLPGGSTPVSNIFFQMMVRSAVLDAEIAPITAAGLSLDIPVKENEQFINWAGVLGIIILITGVTLTFLAPPVGISILEGYVLYGLGTALIIYEVATQHSIFADAIRGRWHSAIDLIWTVLNGIGHFIWSVLEKLYDVLTWLVNAILEYGSILLGLLIVGVGLLIFFYPIHYQIKLWTAGLLMAQGKFTQADRELSGVAKDITRTGKKGLRIASRGGSSAFSKFSTWRKNRGGPE